MRALALHADVIVFVSDVWQTTCTAVRGGGEGFVIDSPIYPEELRALPEVLEHSGFPVSGLLVTHGDWDHLLGRIAFPGVSMGCAPSTVERLTADIGGAQRELRAFAEEHYVEGLAPLGLADLQTLPVPGRLEIGTDDLHLELHAADGHTSDGVAYWLGWAQVLVCGDYLSPIEIPSVSPGGSVAAYRATLARLTALVEHAEWVVPGHGAPTRSQRAREILAEDDAYLTQLGDAPAAAKPPRSRVNAVQRRIHEDNVRHLAGGDA